MNKADREGVERVVAEIQSMLTLAPGGRAPEIVQTVASADQGVGELLEAVDRYLAEARGSGELARRRRAHLRRLFLLRRPRPRLV